MNKEYLNLIFQHIKKHPKINKDELFLVLSRISKFSVYSLEKTYNIIIDFLVDELILKNNDFRLLKAKIISLNDEVLMLKFQDKIISILEEHPSFENLSLKIFEINKKIEELEKLPDKILVDNEYKFTELEFLEAEKIELEKWL